MWNLKGKAINLTQATNKRVTLKEAWLSAKANINYIIYRYFKMRNVQE